MINIKPENTKRKVDSLGRVVIPKGLRDRLGIHENDELDISTMEYENQSYICLSNGKMVDPKYQIAVDVLKELGLEIPSDLNKRLEG